MGRLIPVNRLGGTAKRLNQLNGQITNLLEQGTVRSTIQSKLPELLLIAAGVSLLGDMTQVATTIQDLSKEVGSVQVKSYTRTINGKQVKVRGYTR